MIRLLRRILGHGSRHADTANRAQQTNDMLTALNGRKRNVERQTREIRRTGDPITKTYAGQHSQEEDQ